MKVYRFCDKLSRGEENYYKDFSAWPADNI